MGPITQEKLERFVRESAWEYENVEEHLRQTVPEAAQGAASALILDGMGIPKQAHDSVAVGHQWCGATGKMDNCQVTINLTLASPGRHRNADQLSWPLGMRLDTSKKWIGADSSVYDSSQQQQQYTQRREDVESLLGSLTGKTVVTADHGNMISERSWPIPNRDWGHPHGLYTGELVKIPWLIVEDGKRQTVTAEATVSEHDGVDEDIAEDRLEQLGYR